MKKLIIASLVLASVSTLFAAVKQAMPSAISVLTLTQVAQSTPTYVGQVVVCSNCASANNSQGVLCVSTAAVSQNGYIIAGSSNTGAANTTCK